MEVSGVKFRIDQPLDWAAVTDHAEYLGEMYSTLNVGALGSDQPQVVELRGLTDYNEREQWFLKYVISANRGGGKPAHPPFWGGPETSKNGWKKILEATEANYHPGTFTTLPAYEWSAAPKGGNLHRNVFFRDIKHVPEQAMGYAEFNRETELWQWLAELDKQGIRGMAIPHNSNASKGMMFDANMPDGKPLTKEYVSLRNRFERSIEMMQIKGNSEVHRSFWAADEFADFENADSLGDFSGRDLNAFGRGNWVRYGLGKGLQYQKTLGVNPYHYGIVGGTDNHNGLMANVAEDNFMAGSHGAADATVARARRRGGRLAEGPRPEPRFDHRRVGAAEHPRGDLRRHVQPRNVRHQRPAHQGALLRAIRRGARDRRFQHDDRAGLRQRRADGRHAQSRQRRAGVYRVGREGAARRRRQSRPHPDHQEQRGCRRRAAGHRVRCGVVRRSQAGCKRQAAAGRQYRRPENRHVHEHDRRGGIERHLDRPEFRCAQNALYYVRVIQIPTPRWSTFDAVRAGLPLQDGVASVVQERAWTSPIWYTPAAKSSL